MEPIVNTKLMNVSFKRIFVIMVPAKMESTFINAIVMMGSMEHIANTT